MSRQPKRKSETKIPLPVNSFRLLIEFIILLFMYYCIVHFLTMLRKEQSVGFCQEPRVEGKMLGVDGSKCANDLFNSSLLLLIFPRAQRSL